MRSALDDFHRCARRLGIFGFDLAEDHPKLRHHQRLDSASKCTAEATSRFKVDFAVLDEETKPTIHAVLESVHPESVASLQICSGYAAGNDNTAQFTLKIGSLP